MRPNLVYLAVQSLKVEIIYSRKLYESFHHVYKMVIMVGGAPDLSE